MPEWTDEELSRWFGVDTAVPDPLPSPMPEPEVTPFGLLPAPAPEPQLSPDLLGLKAQAQHNAQGFYAPVSQRMVWYVISQVDKQIGKPMRVEMLRWLFDRPAIITTHLDTYPDGLNNGEAEALLMWARPYKPDGAGAKWSLLNPHVPALLSRFLVEVMHQMELPGL